VCRDYDRGDRCAEERQYAFGLVGPESARGRPVEGSAGLVGDAARSDSRRSPRERSSQPWWDCVSDPKVAKSSSEFATWAPETHDVDREAPREPRLARDVGQGPDAVRVRQNVGDRHVAHADRAFATTSRAASARSNVDFPTPDEPVSATLRRARDDERRIGHQGLTLLVDRDVIETYGWVRRPGGVAARARNVELFQTFRAALTATAVSSASRTTLSDSNVERASSAATTIQSAALCGRTTRAPARGRSWLARRVGEIVLARQRGLGVSQPVDGRDGARLGETNSPE